MALCRACHVYFTHRPVEWGTYIEDLFGAELIDHLNELARLGRDEYGVESKYLDIAAITKHYEGRTT